MTRYLLNTLITPINFDKDEEATIEFERISVGTACKTLKNGFVSAVGHEGTAKVIEQLCGISVPVERRTIFFEKGDEGIHFFLKQRLPEGKVLSKEELENLDFWFVRSKRIR